MKKIVLILSLILIALSQSAEGQTSSRYGWGTPKTQTSRTVFRALIKHTGPIFRAGEETMLWGRLNGIGLSMQGGYRYRNMLIVGGGIMPGAHSSRLNKYLLDGTYRDRVIDNIQYPHKASFDWTYFTMPIYGFVEYEFLQEKFSPSVEFRAGYQVKGEFGGSVYIHLNAGCRFAFGRINMNPYIGWTMNDHRVDLCKSTLNIGTAFWFTNKYNSGKSKRR